MQDRGGIACESRSDGGASVHRAVEILPAHVRQRGLSAAVQHCGQSGGRQVRRRGGPRGGRQQLRDHPDLHRLCLRVQHRLLGHRLPLFRGQTVPGHEDRRHHLPDRVRGAGGRPDAGGAVRLRRPAGAHQHPARDPGRLGPLPRHLRPGSALHVLLQRGDRHLLGPRGQQDPLLLPGGLVGQQHLYGHPLCHRL